MRTLSSTSKVHSVTRLSTLILLWAAVFVCWMLQSCNTLRGDILDHGYTRNETFHGCWYVTQKQDQLEALAVSQTWACDEKQLYHLCTSIRMNKRLHKISSLLFLILIKCLLIGRKHSHCKVSKMMINISLVLKWSDAHRFWSSVNGNLHFWAAKFGSNPMCPMWLWRPSNSFFGSSSWKIVQGPSCLLKYNSNRLMSRSSRGISGT